MIFAFATDDRTLTVFPDAAAAVASCGGIDVAEGQWLFFDDAGVALAAEFAEPAVRKGPFVSHGRYSLRPCAAGRRERLLNVLPIVAAVEGSAELPTASAVARRLAGTDSPQSGSR